MKAVVLRSPRRPRMLQLLSLAGLIVVAGVATAGASDLDPVMEVLGKDDLAGAQGMLKAILAKQPDDPEIHGLLGEIHWRRGELKDAREHFDAALAKSPNDARALAGLALVALGQDDVENAESLANKAVASDKKLWLANFALGRVQIRKGNIEAAFAALERGKDTKKRADGRDLFEEGMGLLALAEKDVEGAETNLIRARALAPNTVEHVMALAAMYESTEQWGQAAKVLEDMQAKIGRSPQLSYRLGYAYEHLRRWNDAAKEYQATLQADSTFVPALGALGHLYLLDTSKTPLAINLLARAVALRPTAAVRLDYGIALTRADRAAEAIPHLEAVQAEDPGPVVKLALARAYLRADMAPKGLAILEGDPDLRAEAQAPDLVLAAAAYIEAKDFAEARSYLDQAEAKEPELSDIAFRRGLIYIYEKNYQAAIEQLRKKLASDPQNTLAWRNLGVAYQGSRDPKGAAEAYRKVTELAPQFLPGWTSYANVLSELGSKDQAKAAFDRALQIDAKSAAALRGRGYLFLASEQYPQAITDLRGATASDPKDLEALVWLAQAQFNSGNKQDAQVSVGKALAMDPSNELAKELQNALAGKSR